MTKMKEQLGYMLYKHRLIVKSQMPHEASSIKFNDDAEAFFFGFLDDVHKYAQRKTTFKERQGYEMV